MICSLGLTTDALTCSLAASQPAASQAGRQTDRDTHKAKEGKTKPNQTKFKRMRAEPLVRT